MFAITGITGQVGGAVARALLAAGQSVRAVVRDAGKGEAWAARGCDVALSEISHADSLKAAFDDAEAVFVVMPSHFDPSPGFAETRAIVAALREALEATHPARVVCISTIGAQATQTSLLSQLGMLEASLGALSSPIAFLRPAWFMENAAWDIAPARNDGVVPSFLQPLDKPVPMVATADVGRVAATLLRETWTGTRTVELEGPRRLSPNDVATAMSRVLGRPVRMDAVPRDTWETLFRTQGMNHPGPRMRMLDGFNESWIEFANRAEAMKGTTDIDTVLAELVSRAG
jgi:uncharacterized protein YbjT (DUF2867 family)